MRSAGKISDPNSLSAMENVDRDNRELRRKGRVNTCDLDSPVIEELQQERLRQSRIIARQLDTIGKLKRALDLVMGERSSRRGSLSLPMLALPDLNIPDIEFSDVGLQTEPSQNRTRSQDADYDQIKRALGYLAEENLRLSHQRNATEEALLAEKEKAKRILTVCTRISSSPGGNSGISSPALAKWVSLGLEDTVFPSRDRTETFDDGFFHKSAPGAVAESSTTRSRSALSEGDTPVAGLDLDMVYGNAFDHSGASNFHPDAFPMTPKASFRKHEVQRSLCGTYWNGQSSVSLSLRADDLEVICPDKETYLIRVLDSETVLLSQDGGGAVKGRIRVSRIEWPSLETIWEKIEGFAEKLAGHWWTGFSIVTLLPTPDMSGRLEGTWGFHQITLTASSHLKVDGGNFCQVRGAGVVEMTGSVGPKYGSGGGRLVIRWDNGQVWELTH